MARASVTVSPSKQRFLSPKPSEKLVTKTAQWTFNMERRWHQYLGIIRIWQRLSAPRFQSTHGHTHPCSSTSAQVPKWTRPHIWQLQHPGSIAIGEKVEPSQIHNSVHHRSHVFFTAGDSLPKGHKVLIPTDPCLALRCLEDIYNVLGHS